MFWTNLPIQSWAPMTMSGPLPALSAVMKLVWRSLATTCTATVNPPCWSAHCVANSSIEGAFFSSAQMTRSAVVSAATASPPSEDALPPPWESELSALEPQAAAARVLAMAVMDRNDRRLRVTVILLRI